MWLDSEMIDETSCIISCESTSNLHLHFISCESTTKIFIINMGFKNQFSNSQKNMAFKFNNNGN